MNDKQITDQLGRKVVLPNTPKRIVSLVPSQTELLIDLGLKDQLIGRTKFCIHPASVRDIPIVGGTKNPDIAKINALKPDLVIMNKEENRQEDAQNLAKHCPVWVSNVNELDSALEMIFYIGKITGTESNATKLILEIKRSFGKLKNYPPKNAIYFIWRKPWMVAGKDTFISSMMSLAGYNNMMRKKRYPTLSLEQLALFNPEVVLLSSEPYPFQEKHITELHAIWPNAKFQLVCGEYFGWYGSRLARCANYFQEIRSF